MSFQFVVEQEGMRLDAKELWFLSLANPSRPAALGLRIGIPALDPRAADLATKAAWLVMEKGLGGEKARGMIQHLDVVALPPEPRKQGFIPLPELPQFLSWRETHECETVEDDPESGGK